MAELESHPWGGGGSDVAGERWRTLEGVVRMRKATLAREKRLGTEAVGAQRDERGPYGVRKATRGDGERGQERGGGWIPIPSFPRLTESPLPPALGDHPAAPPVDCPTSTSAAGSCQRR